MLASVSEGDETHVLAGNPSEMKRGHKSMARGSWCVLMMTAFGAAGAFAQNPLSTDTKFWYDTIKKDVIAAADDMPEANYSFKPAPTVRSFGEIIGHIA